MIAGHGDDIYNNPDIRVNFSSNIYVNTDMSALKEHLCQHISLINNYPEPAAHSLEAAIADKYGIAADCVLVTNGATDAIYLIAQTFGQEGGCHSATILHPTFSEYEDACHMFGIQTMENHEPVPMNPQILWLCNPNNPTGSVHTPQDIREYAKSYSYVVVDQSYEDYTLEPMMTHREAAMSDNILQLHSLTKKYAIPGLRIGYVVASPDIIGRLRRNLRPWSVNALAIEAGRWLTNHDIKTVQDLPAYLKESERLRNRLNGISGIEARESHTHFMLASIATGTAGELKDYLVRQHHILIRDASNFQGLTPHHFRICTQSPQENELLIRAIEEYILRNNNT